MKLKFDSTCNPLKAIPLRIICLDEGFQDNDQLKTNAAQLMKSKGDGEF